MKAGWQIRPLAEIADCCLGKMLDKQKNRGERQQYLRNVNVRWFEFDLSDLLEMPFETTEQERYSVRKGDLVICEGGYPGRCAIWEDEEPVYFQKALHRVRCHKPERAKWVQYYLWMSDADGSLRSHFTGSGIQHFTGQALARLKIPLPPLEEQRRIVAVLDEAFAAIATATANAEKNLANARELFEVGLAASYEVEGKTAALGSIAKFVRGPFGGSLKKEIFEPSGFAVYEQQHAIYDQFSIVRYFVNKTKFSEMKRFQVQSGDIVMSCSGTIGKVSLVPKHAPEGIINQALLKLSPASTVDPKYLLWYMRSAPFLKQIASRSGGAALQNVASVAILKEISVSLPNLETQLAISSHIEILRAECDALQKAYSHKKDVLLALKQSLLHRAFNGELTATTPETIVA